MSKTYQKNGFHSPRWLAYPEHWPEQKEITLAKESEKEVKMIKEFVCIATEKSEKLSAIENFWISGSYSDNILDL